MHIARGGLIIGEVALFGLDNTFHIEMSCYGRRLPFFLKDLSKETTFTFLKPYLRLRIYNKAKTDCRLEGPRPLSSIRIGDQLCSIRPY